MSRFSRTAWKHVNDRGDENGFVELSYVCDAIDDMDTDWQNEFDEMERTLKNQVSDLEDDVRDLKDTIRDKEDDIRQLEYEIRRMS
jgi:peptidoglycan hydrolase CwlO-like protein